MKASFLVSERWQINTVTTMLGAPKPETQPKAPKRVFTTEEMRIAVLEMIDYMRKLFNEIEDEKTTPERRLETEEELAEILGHFKSIRKVTE